MLGAEATCFCFVFCLPGRDGWLEEGSHDCAPEPCEQLASPSFMAAWQAGGTLSRSCFLGLLTSSLPGGYTLFGFTHIHRLGLMSGPVQRKRFPIAHWLWGSRQPQLGKQNLVHRAHYLPSLSGLGFFSKGSLGGSTSWSLYLATSKERETERESRHSRSLFPMIWGLEDFWGQLLI